MRIAFTTLGCKINQFETDQLRSELSTQGNEIVPFTEQADVYIINTCTVTAKTDTQCRQLIRSAAKRANGAKVIVTGCYASTRPDELRKIPGVASVVGNDEKHRIASQIADKKGVVPAVSDTLQRIPAGRTRGFLKIQDGCDNRCSYCIVPDARGRSRSMAPDRVREQFDLLIASGCPEIVLTGIHVGMFGADLSEGVTFSGLIGRLLERRGTSRIRISSIEPNEITDGLIAFLGNGVCRHLHIPLQSGDDAILRAMRRKYSSSFYRDLILKLAKLVPDIALGADVITGFPGEGDQEFRNTCELIQSLPLTHLHVFSYSPRPGTPAALLPQQVPEKTKKERSELLRGLGAAKNLEFRRRFAGRKLSVVVEDKRDPASHLLTGLTDNYIRMGISGVGNEHIGEEIVAEVEQVSERRTTGRIIVTY